MTDETRTYEINDNKPTNPKYFAKGIIPISDVKDEGYTAEGGHLWSYIQGDYVPYAEYIPILVANESTKNYEMCLELIEEMKE